MSEATTLPPAPVGEVSPRPRARVLLADDDDTIRLALAALIARAGHDVTPVADANAARGVLERERFDVILLDVGMNGNPLGLYRELESEPRTAGRCVIMSGTIDPCPVCIEAEEKGRYLSKPFGYAELVRTVEEIRSKEEPA